MTTTSQPTRLGIIGLGHMGARYLEVAEKLGFELVAAFDRGREPYAFQARPDLAAHSTTDVEAFWANSMDIVVVASTAPSHLGHLYDGLKHGVRRMIVEKPLCTNVAAGEKALDAIRQAGVRVIVNHGRRYSPNVIKLLTLDGSPQMGSLRTISISIGASGLGCVGTHFFDLCNQLYGGPPIRVRAIDSSDVTPPNPRGEEFFDPGGCALLEYEGGRRAIIDTSDDCGVPLAIEYRFTYGRVIVADENEPWTIQRRNAESRKLQLSRYVAEQEVCVFSDFKPFGIYDMIEASLLDAVGNGAPVSSVDDALQAVCVFAAVRAAARTGKTITLPLSRSEKVRDYPIP